MQTDLSLTFEGARVRVVIDAAGDPWWVAKDVCDCLGNVNSRRALSRVPVDEKGVHIVNTLGGEQSLQIVNEPGLYRLIFTSRVDQAERFKRWVFHDVLPQIRRTGAYVPPGAQPVDVDPGDLPPDVDHWLALVREARRTYGRAAAARIWADSPLPQSAVPDGDSRLDRVAAFIAACCEVTGNHRDFVPSRDLIERAALFYRAQGWPMPGKRGFSNLLRAVLMGPDATVPPGMVDAAKVSATGYRGLRLSSLTAVT